MLASQKILPAIDRGVMLMVEKRYAAIISQAGVGASQTSFDLKAAIARQRLFRRKLLSSKLAV